MKRILLASLLPAAGLLANTPMDLESFKALKPLDSKAFHLLEAKKIGKNYMVTADMEFRGAHKTIDIFISEDKKMIVFGNAFDTETGKQLYSETRLKEQKKLRELREAKKNHKYDPSPLKGIAPLSLGEGEDEYFLFTDFDCPFCKELEKKLGSLKSNVKLYILPYPIERLHPNSKSKALAFMEMSSEKQKNLIFSHKLSSIDTKGFEPKKETLEKMDLIKKEAKKAMLTGTPFLVDSNGKRIKDYSKILEKK